MNILFTCAGRRNYLLNYFREVPGFKGKIFAADMQVSAPAMADADVPLVVPEVYAENYVGTLLDICKKYGIDALLSLNDLELPILASNREAFKKLGVKLIISSEEVIELCFDKWKTSEFAIKTGIQVPKTYLTLTSVKEAFKTGFLKFPLIIKPRWGSASIGIEIAENQKELELAYKLLTFKLNRSILARVSETEKKKSILIQERMDGKEFGVDILNDFNGRTVQVYIKEKLAMRAGETDKSVLRNIPELEMLSFRIGNSLGHIGNMDCDIFENNGAYFLLEMNPRFGGGYPFSHMAGADYPAAICAWIEGSSYDFSEFKKEYDQPYAKCDTLIRTFK